VTTMKTIRSVVARWLARLVRPHRETDEARERVVRDRHRVEVQATRIERSADALEARIHENHISASIERMLRRAR
jgi:hypothetical protein